MFSRFNPPGTWHRYADSAQVGTRFPRTRFFLISSYNKDNKDDPGS
jgi:hypothetical protein